MANKLSRLNFKQTKVIVPVIATAVVALVALIIPAISNAAQPTVNLGSTSNFAVLAGSGITNTGPTTVSGTAGGDMGSDPTPAFTGDTLVTTTGTKYTAPSAVVTAAKTALITAYDDAAGRTPATTVTADLGGQTLVGGVYNAAAAMALTGTLILDGQNNPDAVWIFQAGSTLTTASSSVVQLINGAQPCHVFWQVGSSATFGTSSDFTGHVLALTSITATTGATFKGQLLARNGAVTLDTNTIVNDKCEEAPVVTPSPTASTDTGGELPNTDSNNCFCCANAVSCRAWSRLKAKGLSTTTCLPAFSASSASGAWLSFGLAMTTRSISARWITAW